MVIEACEAGGDFRPRGRKNGAEILLVEPTDPPKTGEHSIGGIRRRGGAPQRGPTVSSATRAGPLREPDATRRRRRVSSGGKSKVHVPGSSADPASTRAPGT